MKMKPNGTSNLTLINSIPENRIQTYITLCVILNYSTQTPIVAYLYGHSQKLDRQELQIHHTVYY